MSISGQRINIGNSSLCYNPVFSSFVSSGLCNLFNLSELRFTCKMEMTTILPGCWEKEMRYLGKLLVSIQ